MKNPRYCIRCEMEDKYIRGDFKVFENTVSGEAYMCERHYNEWVALQELIEEKELYGDNSTEDTEY